jgi:hypothetical protein
MFYLGSCCSEACVVSTLWQQVDQQLGLSSPTVAAVAPVQTSTCGCARVGQQSTAAAEPHKIPYATRGEAVWANTRTVVCIEEWQVLQAPSALAAAVGQNVPA